MSEMYQFVPTDVEEIETRLISRYEALTGHRVKPADPDRLFIAWVANVIVQERAAQNYTANQNLPSRAEGENLDALGRWIYALERKGEQAAKCTMRFHIQEAQTSAVLVPAGTRVSDAQMRLVWYTTEDALIAVGATYVDTMAECETPGIIGNSIAIGQINTLIDVDNILYYLGCENITESDGGSEREDDEAYFKMMRAVLDSYSTAGPKDAYIYRAKSVSDEIADVKVIRPHTLRRKTLTVYQSGENRCVFLGGEGIVLGSVRVYEEGSPEPLTAGADYTLSYVDGLLKIALASNGAVATASQVDVEANHDLLGHVDIFAIMKGGTIANGTIKDAILTACNDETTRPLTDYVTVRDPEIAAYNIDLTYYINSAAQQSVADIQARVDEAVQEYIAWQRAELGRDINPSKLEYLLMQTGIKRVAITSPTFTTLRSGADNDVPQLAQVGTVTLTNGGFEDE